MIRLAYLLALIGLITSASVLRAENLPLFVDVARPSTLSIDHPATFFRIDSEAFNQARTMADDEMMDVTLSLPQIGTITARVGRYRVIDERTQIVAITANGPERVQAPKSVLLRGRIPAYPSAFVILAIYPDWCSGTITFGPEHGSKAFQISPLSLDASGSTMIVYNTSDVPARPSWSCGTLDTASVRIPLPKTEDGVQNQQFRRITLAIECDEPFYIDHGRNLTKSTEYTEAVIGASSALYERDVTASLRIGQLTVWTVVDPYTSTQSDGMLVQFRDRWRSLHSGVDRTLAHLFSGINSIGGIAYVDQLCNKQWGYAVSGTNNNVTYPASGYVWDTDVVCHELGHNIGSPHTHACQWAPPIDSCYASEGGCFSGTVARKGTIMSYCHLTSQGTELVFHARVVGLMRTKLSNGNCTPLVWVVGLDLTADTISLCKGTQTSLTATVTNGQAPYSYRWKSTAFDTVTTSATFTFKPLSTYNVYLTMTDGAGNVRTDSCLIIVSDKPFASLSSTDATVCPGTLVRVDALVTNGRPPYSYRWLSNGKLVDSLLEFLIIKLDTSSTIQLAATDLNGCSDTVQYRFTVPSTKVSMVPPAITLPALPVCNDASSMVVSITNPGAEEIVIDSMFTGSKIAVAVNSGLPLILAGGSTREVRFNIVAKATGAISDSIVLRERACKQRFKIVVNGVRPAFRVSSPLPVDLGAKIVCTTPTERTAKLRVDNASSYPIQIVRVAGRLLGEGFSVVDGPIDIPALADRTFSIVGAINRLPGAIQDTLRFTYISDDCEGTLSAPASLRVTGVSIDHPSIVTFDTVTVPSSSVTKQFGIDVSLIGAPRLTVRHVEISGPFTTTMSPGLEIVHGRTLSVPVTFDPTLLPNEVEASGELRFRLDSCVDERIIALRAYTRVVGVNSEQELEADVRYISGGIVQLSGFSGRARLYDVRGNVVADHSTNATESTVFNPHTSGVYILVLTDGSRMRTVTIIAIR